MKKLSTILLILAASSILLLGCDKEVETVDIGLTPTPTEAQTEVLPEESTEESMENKVRSQVTNEWIDEDLENQRPISVTFPNDTSALPQYNVSKSGVLYQFPVEGKISRLLGIIDEWQDIERIGNVRSTREYFVYAGLEWDPLYCHFGNPYYADIILAKDGTDNINGLTAANDVFYRSKDRPAPQNAYLNAEGILNGAEDKKYSLTYTNNHVPDHFKYADKNDGVDLSTASGSVTAGTVNLAKAYPIDKTYFEYNDEKKEYDRFQYGKEHVDAVNNQQLSFKNIIIQETTTEVIDAKGYLAMAMHDSGKSGFYFTNGKGIPITWSKPMNNFEPTRYFDEDGNEITLNTGKTMICVIDSNTGYTYN